MVLKNVQLFGPPCMCGLLTSILYSSSYDSKFIAGARRGWIIMACTVYYSRPYGSGVARVRKWVGTEGRSEGVSTPKGHGRSRGRGSGARRSRTIDRWTRNFWCFSALIVKLLYAVHSCNELDILLGASDLNRVTAVGSGPFWGRRTPPSLSTSQDDGWVGTCPSVHGYHPWLHTPLPYSIGVPTPPGMARSCVCKISRTWKVLEFAGQRCGRCVADADAKICASAHLYSVFEQFLCYFFATCDSDEHILQYGCCCCLSVYWNIAGLRQGPGKMLLGPGKVLEFFVTKRVGTLSICTTRTSVIGTTCSACCFAVMDNQQCSFCSTLRCLA